MNLFDNYPENYKNIFKQECLEMNYSRVYYMSRIVLFMSAVMFLMSIWIDDSKAIQIANGGLFVGNLVAILATMGKNPQIFSGHQVRKQVVIDFFYIIAIAWGVAMAGFNPKNPVVFFDITIVCILVAVYYITSFQKLALYFLVSYTVLIFATPYMKYSDYYPPLVVSPILFMIICFYVSRILYKQVLEKFVLSEELRANKIELEMQLDVTSEELQNTEQNISRDIIKTLVKVLEYYDGYTRGHSENVATYAKLIASEMGLGADQQDQLYVCGLVHDIGKILIPIHILNKPERLTKEEFEIIAKHSQYGFEMLNESKHIGHIAKIILHHHEHWDGKGYPTGLKQEDIPIESQILMVADTWDAMRSERVYRKAKSLVDSKSELLRCRGSQFSPNVVDAMFRVIDKIIKSQ